MAARSAGSAGSAESASITFPMALQLMLRVAGIRSCAGRVLIAAPAHGEFNNPARCAAARLTFAASSSALVAFGRNNQLQQFLWVVQKLICLLRVHAQRARRKLRRHCCFRYRRVGWDEAHLIHVNVRIAFERRPELLRKLARHRARSGRKAAYEPLQALVCQLRGKMDTRDSSRR
jgi:hypothetical protein